MSFKVKVKHVVKNRSGKWSVHKTSAIVCEQVILNADLTVDIKASFEDSTHKYHQISFLSVDGEVWLEDK